MAEKEGKYRNTHFILYVTTSIGDHFLLNSIQSEKKYTEFICAKFYCTVSTITIVHYINPKIFDQNEFIYFCITNEIKLNELTQHNINYSC